MKTWLWKHLLAAEYDVSAAINGCVADYDDLAADDQQRVKRTGLRVLLAEMVKGRTLTIENGHTDQLPLFASIEDNGHFYRIGYHQATLDQLRQMQSRESMRQRRSNEKLERLAVDIGMYERHPGLSTLQAVWDAEHVEYRIDEAA